MTLIAWIKRGDICYASCMMEVLGTDGVRLHTPGRVPLPPTTKVFQRYVVLALQYTWHYVNIWGPVGSIIVVFVIRAV